MDKHSPINLTPAPRSDEQTVTQWVYQSLRQAVMDGDFMPGRQLTIRALAQMLDVSPMPVREALRQLAAENALAIQGNRRVMVPQMTAMKFTELCEARIAVECHECEICGKKGVPREWYNPKQLTQDVGFNQTQKQVWCNACMGSGVTAGERASFRIS